MRGEPGWACRPYRPGDELALSALFARVFQRESSPEHWRWKLGFDASPAPNVWLAVDDEDRPVCQYAGIPRRARLPDGERDVMVIVDAMTAPEARGRGALTSVVTRAHAAWREAGVAFAIGTPNEQWRSRQRALGWQRLARLRWRIRPLKPSSLAARRLRLGGLARLGLADTAWNGLWNLGTRLPDTITVRVAGLSDVEMARRLVAAAPGPDGRALLVRDAGWVARRYLERPGSPYALMFATREEQTLGYAAYRVRHVDDRRIGELPELIAPGDDRLATGLLGAAIRQLAADGAEMVLALAVPGSREDRLLRRRGFLFSWATFDVQAIVLDPALTIEALREAGPWVLSGGDFDFI